MEFCLHLVVGILLMSSLVTVVVFSGSIESNGDGTYCVSKIPKRGILVNCTSDSVCEDLLGLPVSPLNALRCGDNGECITTETPKNEYCKEACGSTSCGKFCLQEHETKTAMYCIETRDHPNAMPNSKATNKYYCTCTLENAGAIRHFY